MPISFAEDSTTLQMAPSLRSVPLDLAGFGHRTKQFPIFDGCGGHPGIYGLFDPQGNGDGADPAAFAA